jgi:SSS family solute:Na+ symporter
VITLFLPFFYNSGCASIFEYLERRFGLASRTVMSGIFLFGNFAYSGIMLYTTALVLEYITGIDVVAAIMIVAVVAVTYTMMGGIAAVIWTDVVQTAILFLGAIIALVLLIGELPDGLMGTLRSLNEAGKTNPFETSLDPAKVATIWTGIVAMSIYHVVVYGVNQMMVQRTLTARSIGDAKKAYIMMGYVAFFIFFLFFGMGILFYGYYGGKPFDNENLIVLEFVAHMGFPGLMGIVTAAIVAASMSSLDSSLNSMATVTTLDFYEKFIKKNAATKHYLSASRWFTFAWAVAMVIPAIMFTQSAGSVIEILSKVGSFFVGAKLAMFGLGFFSKHTTQRGLLLGVLAGFLSLAYIEYNMNIAWPWYCAIGGGVSIVVAWTASILLTGLQTDYSPFTVRGQLKKYADEGLPIMHEGWYVVSGKVDRAGYGLLVFFVACLGLLGILNAMI